MVESASIRHEESFMTHGSPATFTSPVGVASAASKDSVNSAVAILKAVGHPLRFQIVDLLARHPARSVSELCDALDTKQPIISQQLSILRRGHVVHGRRNGNRVLYSLKSHRVGELVRLFTGSGQNGYGDWSGLRGDSPH
jgi:ArsR family transcriptional regulator